MKVPIVVSADFECSTKPIDTCQPNPKLSYTMQYQEHIPSSFCYYIECIDDTIYSKAPVSYVAKSEYDDVAKIFLNSLVKDVEDICHRFLKKPKKMIFTAGEYSKKGEFKPVKLELRFIDSFRFMRTSLDALIRNLDMENCKNLKKFYPEESQFILLKRKGVFPYDYVISADRLEEKSLPPKEAFYSKLNEENITDQDYEHAKTVWKKIGIKTVREYQELYNISDALLLADVLANFRGVCIKNYNLDPAWFYTAPGLAWEALLKITKVELELLSDVDMMLMLTQGIRGGGFKSIQSS